ncbi:MAG: hypothetical protein M5U28_10990 [Sandaracinaceae bacterium]|nr:hypothetical protein [Sandaracinaceae bacterium]
MEELRAGRLERCAASVGSATSLHGPSEPADSLGYALSPRPQCVRRAHLATRR